MSKDTYIFFLFIIIVAGLALSIPYIIDYLIKLFTPKKKYLKPEHQRAMRQDFYSDEFGLDEVYEPLEIGKEIEEETESFSSNIYICPECGSLKLRMQEAGKITCADCHRIFLINGEMNQNLH
ncbi:hypothetical protein KKB18_00085 [bacterium]|nr:hypothetical protein [bacterium]